jgi:hypothetical protein
MIVRRLAQMSLPEEVRRITRHALVWAWKDEEMHALYPRIACPTLILWGERDQLPAVRVRERSVPGAGSLPPVSSSGCCLRSPGFRATSTASPGCSGQFRKRHGRPAVLQVAASASVVNLPGAGEVDDLLVGVEFNALAAQ